MMTGILLNALETAEVVAICDHFGRELELAGLMSQIAISNAGAGGKARTDESTGAEAEAPHRFCVVGKQTEMSSGRATKQQVGDLKSQFVTSSWGGMRRATPYAFTEQGVAMLSSVLRSARAIQVNIEIMRAFVRLRRLLDSNAELGRKPAALERKYDAQFKVVFDAIRELMMPPEPKKKRPIGFGPWEEK